MLKKLRRSMTLLCAAITGVILLVMSLISLGVSERQLERMEQASFDNVVSNVALRLSTDRYLDWTWLMQTEAENRMIIHIEDNGSPLLFPGSWQPRTPRDNLVSTIHTYALDMGVDVSKRPRSTLNTPQVGVMLQSGGVLYRATAIVQRTDRGFFSLTVLKDISQEQADIRGQRWIFGGLSFCALLALFAFSWWFSGRAIRPVEEGNQRQAEFIAAASHELRTPLAVIRTSAAALEYEENSSNGQFTRAIERECERTSKLVDDLLALANADAKTWRVDLGPVELEQIIFDSMDSFSALATEKHLELTADLPRSALPIVAGDEHRLTQLISILLDNACHYTPGGGRIVISARKAGRQMQLRVADNGPGIPAEHQEQVFDRFYRVDASRSKKEHYGLGLSIAREIVRLHKGKISLSDTPGGGLTVTVELPLPQRHSDRT